MDDAFGARLSHLSRSVAGHVVLVTGAGSGIGRATAHLFADEGARVAVTDVDGDAAGTVAAEVEGAGGAARAWGLDVTDRPEVRRVVDEVAAWGPGLDVLVNNAGAAMGAPIGHDAFVDTWDRALDLMATAQTTAIRAALPHLRASSAGRIVNVSSTEGVGGSAGMAAYTAAKHAVVGLTRFANRGHLARAALESTAFQVAELVEAMRADATGLPGGLDLAELRVDGGMVVNETLMQFQSDILGVPVIRPVVNETTALGAAYAAGLAIGYWADTEDIRNNWAVGKTWEPAMDESERSRLYAEWNKAVERTYNWSE